MDDADHGIAAGPSKDARYVRTSKTGRGPGGETWVAMTRKGMKAYKAHVTALREVVDGTVPVTADADGG